jgi:hypothetical protein
MIMGYPSLEALITKLQTAYQNHGSQDALFTVGNIPVTIAVWNRNEPFQLDAPLNLKWLKGNVLYSRISRSPSGSFMHTWTPVTTITQALEAQLWDRPIPINWPLIQHMTNIDDPHQSELLLNSRFEYSGTSKTEHAVNHNLSLNVPAVSVYVNKIQVIPDEIEVVDANNIIIRFATATSCEAVIQ